MGNNTLKIGFIDYLERQNWWHSKEFFYDLISLNLKNHFDTSFKISKSLRKENQEVLLNKYLHNSSEKGWEENYCEILKDRGLYIDYIQKHDRLFSYEASPGVIDLMEKGNKKYCDIRISPIRFLSDVLLAVKTNDAELQEALRLSEIKVKQMRGTANKIQVMYQYRIRGEEGLITEPRVIYVGQTKLDSSLYFQKKICRIEDFEEEIKKDSKGKRLYYLSHPAATTDHIDHELSVLKKIDKQCEIINENSYRVLCSGADDFFIGISSGLLQEAQIFGKKAKSYIPHACPVHLTEEVLESDNNDYYFQIPLDTFLSKEFYDIFLLGRKSNLLNLSLDNLRENQLRFLHSAWWSYAHLMALPNQFTSELRETLGFPYILKDIRENEYCLSQLLEEHQKFTLKFQQKENSFVEQQKSNFLVKKIIQRRKWDKRYCIFLSKFAFSSKKRKDYGEKIKRLESQIQELKKSQLNRIDY